MVEPPSIGNEAWTLLLEHLPGGAPPHLRMRMFLGPSDTAVLEPGVELGVALEPRPRHEEPASDDADLVLDLALLPARGGRAGDRLDEVVSAHLLEATVVGAVTADEDRVHGRLHVVVDAPRTGPAEEREGPVVRVEDHLLALAGIGPHEQHPAVAEPDMRDLHRRGHPVDQDDLMAPVELVGLARIEAQRHVGGSRRLAFRPRPRRGVAPDRVVAALVAERLKLLEDPDHRQPIALRLAGVLRQHPIELILPRPDLRLRLDAALVGELRRAGPDDPAHRVPRHAQFTADLLDRLLVLPPVYGFLRH
jgi:hypothetical protein